MTVKIGQLIESGRPEDEIILKFLKNYEKGLEKNNAFDFDDLIQKVTALFRQEKQILEKYQRQYQYILIDEYQDLNNAQYELIRLLAGKTPNLSVVGDDAQSIYRWRGSNFEIFLNFEKDWPKSETIFLEQNYRSTQNIISAASAVIMNNRFQKPKNLWTENSAGSPLKIQMTADEEEEADIAAEKISEIRSSNKKESVVILYRTNAQSRAIEQALLGEEIPYKIFGGPKFYERKEIRDIIAGLRLVANPRDQISRERLEKTLKKSGFLELQEKLAKSKKTVSAGPTATPSPADLIGAFLKGANYEKYLEKNFTNPEERKENIGGLIEFASRFDDLSQFLEQISLLQPTDALLVKKNENESPVSLMSIHLAKGLEFDNVFLIGCNQGILPHAMSLKNQSEFEEERRLMYVAMTRAKKNLFLSFYDAPSQFLSEIPTEHAEFAGTKNPDDDEYYIEI